MASKILLVDCDTGVDDAIALLYLLADPGIELAGITTVFGNASAATAGQNTLAVLDLAGRTGQVPVAVGSEQSRVGKRGAAAQHVHGDNGLGNVQLPPPRAALSEASAVELIVSTARARPGQVHLLATAPLTNVAEALDAEPRLPELLNGMTIMGGAALVPGNVTPVAEANIWNDPEAAQAVLSASWPVTLVPLDATMKVLTSEEHRARLAAAPSPIAHFAAGILDHYFEFYRSVFGRRCSPCHDVLAAAIAVGEARAARAATVPVTVDTTSGPSRGATVCDLRGTYKGETVVEGANCTVVLETAGDMAQAVVDRLCAFSPP